MVIESGGKGHTFAKEYAAPAKQEGAKPAANTSKAVAKGAAPKKPAPSAAKPAP